MTHAKWNPQPLNQLRARIPAAFKKHFTLEGMCGRLMKGEGSPPENEFDSMDGVRIRATVVDAYEMKHLIISCSFGAMYPGWKGPAFTSDRQALAFAERRICEFFGLTRLAYLERLLTGKGWPLFVCDTAVVASILAIHGVGLYHRKGLIEKVDS